MNLTKLEYILIYIYLFLIYLEPCRAETKKAPQDHSRSSRTSWSPGRGSSMRPMTMALEVLGLCTVVSQLVSSREGQDVEAPALTQSLIKPALSALRKRPQLQCRRQGVLCTEVASLHAFAAGQAGRPGSDCSHRPSLSQRETHLKELVF